MRTRRYGSRGSLRLRPTAHYAQRGGHRRPRQHRAHATSLGAILPIATVGAVTFAVHDQIDPYIAGMIAIGSLVGAPIGARLMMRIPEAALRVVFGILIIVVGGLILWP